MTPSEAFQFALKAHGDQKDKAGQPYIYHVIDVALRAATLAKTNNAWLREEIMIAALLHDVLEDTSITEDELAIQVKNPNVMAILQLVTRPPLEEREGETYLEWIERICRSQNLGAIIVKYADNLSNSSAERLANLPEAERSIERRYSRARLFLETAYKHNIRLRP